MSNALSALKRCTLRWRLRPCENPNWIMCATPVDAAAAAAVYYNEMYSSDVVYIIYFIAPSAPSAPDIQQCLT